MAVIIIIILSNLDSKLHLPVYLADTHVLKLIVTFLFAVIVI